MASRQCISDQQLCMFWLVPSVPITLVTMLGLALPLGRYALDQLPIRFYLCEQ